MTDTPRWASGIGWKCEDFAAHLEAGGPELGPAASAMLSMHLQTCETCRSLLASRLASPPTQLPASLEEIAAELETGTVILRLERESFPLAASAETGGFVAKGLSVAHLVRRRFAARRRTGGANVQLVAGQRFWAFPLERLDDLRPEAPDVLRFAASKSSGPVRVPPNAAAHSAIFRCTTEGGTVTFLATAADEVGLVVTGMDDVHHL